MRILLAEDDISIQKVAALALGRVGGHHISLASDGKKTLLLAREELPDVILLDVMMPEMDGFECCLLLKKDEKTKNIPIIFLTARAQSPEIQKGLQLGAIGYIVKPFDPMTLSKQVEKIVNENLASTDGDRRVS